MVRAKGLGLLIFLVGAWGGIVAFIGPLIRLGAGVPAWTWTQGFAELQVPAAAACALGGVFLMASGPRGARLGGWLGVVGGSWFILGPVFEPLWTGRAIGAAGLPGPTWLQTERVLAYHAGTGILALLLAVAALGAVAAFRKRAAAAPPPVPPVPAESAEPSPSGV